VQKIVYIFAVDASFFVFLCGSQFFLAILSLSCLPTSLQITQTRANTNAPAYKKKTRTQICPLTGDWKAKLRERYELSEIGILLLAYRLTYTHTTHMKTSTTLAARTHARTAFI